MTCEGVGVTRGAAPRVGICRREDDMIGIGPVVVEAFPNAAGAFRDIGVSAAEMMYLEVLVGTVAKQLRARLVKEIMRLGRSTSANHRDAVCRESVCRKKICQPGQGRAVGYACPDDFAPCDSARDIRLELF